MTPRVRFEDEAAGEYREAGRWYESRRLALGLEFFDEVDSTIRRIVAFPQAATRVPGLPRLADVDGIRLIAADVNGGSVLEFDDYSVPVRLEVATA